MLRDALGQRLTVLRPAAYHQNLLAQALAGMHHGALLARRAVHATSTSPTSAEVAADALGGPTPGVTLDLAGPEVLTTRQLAELAAAVLGREVSDMRIALAGVAGRAGRRAREPGP